MSDIEEHAEQLLALVRELEQHEDEQTRNKVHDLLEHVDHLHRSCVWRLFELMTELGGKGLVDRVAQDPAVKMLFMLYDLIPADPLMPLEADVRVAQPSAGGFIPLRSVRGRKPSWKVGFACCARSVARCSRIATRAGAASCRCISARWSTQRSTARGTAAGTMRGPDA
jgi:hypothetical protein